MPEIPSENWQRHLRVFIGILALLSALTLVEASTHFCAVLCWNGVSRSMTFLRILN